MTKTTFLLVGLFSFICISASLKGQTISSQQDGPWDQASTWLGGIVPTSSNSTSVIINNNITITSTAYPSGSPLIIDNVTISNSSSANIIVNSNAFVTLANGSGTDLTFLGIGTMNVSGYLIAKNGTTFSGSTISNFTFLTGSTYEHQATDPTVSLPTAIYNSASTVLITGFASGGTLNSSWNVPLGNVVYNCANQASSPVDFAGFLAQIQGNLTILNTGASGGRILFSSTTTTVINIGGDLSVSGNSRLLWTTTGNATVNVGGNFAFNPSGLVSSSGFVFGTNGSGTLNVTGNSSMTGGTWIFSNNSSATSSFNLGGNLSCSSTFASVFGSTSTINFIGTAIQQNFNPTGATFPSTLILTINSSAGVNLLGTLVLSGVTNLISGTLTLQNSSLSMNGVINRTSGVIATTGAPTLIIGGSGAVPSDLSIAPGSSFQIFGLNRPNVTLITNSNFSVADLQLLAGTLTNNGAITISNGGLVEIASTSTANTGKLSNVVVASGTYDLKYTNDIGLSSGPELPSSSSTLGSLTKLGISTLTITKSITVNGGLNISSGAFTCNANNVDVNSFTNSGTFNAPISSATTGLTLTGNFVNTGTFNNNSGTVVVGGAVSFFGTPPTLNNLTIGPSGVLTSPSFLSIQGNFINNGSFVSGNNTFNFIGGGVQTISGSTNTQFYNLAVNKSGGSLTVNSSETVINNLILTSGILAINSNLLSLSNGSTITRSSGSISTSRPAGGPWNLIYATTTSFTATGFEIPSSGTVISLTLNSSSGTSIGLSAAQPLNVSGAFVILNSGNTFSSGSNNVSAGSLTNAGIFNAPSSSAAIGLTLNGNFTNSGTFNNNSGTIVIGGAVNFLGTPPTLNHLSIGPSGAFTLPASLSIQGNFTNNGSLISGLNTINFTGSATQSISGVSNSQFYNFVVNKINSSVTFNSTGTIVNNLTIIAGTLRVSAAVSVSSSSSQVTLTSGILIINSSLLTIANGATIIRAAGAISTSRPAGGPWNLIYTNNSDVTSGFEIPASGNLTNLTLNNSSGTSVSLAASQPLNVSGAFISSTGTIFIAGANNVSAGSITNGGTFNAPGSSASTGLTLNGNFTNNGTFTNNSGTVVIAGVVSILNIIPIFNNLTVSASGIFTSPSALTLQGNLQNDGSFISGSGTITFSGNTAKQIKGTHKIVFNSITVVNGAQPIDLSLEASSGADLTGILTMGASSVFDTDGAADNKVFTLLSSADRPTFDASIAALSGVGQLPGKITVQRYLSRIGVAQFGFQVYRDISSPVNTTVFDLQSSLPVTGPFANASVVTGADNSFSSITRYDETVITDTDGDGGNTFDDGWTDFPASSGNSQTTFFARGLGYSMFIYGSDAPVNNNNYESWSLRGPIWNGTFNLPVSYSSSGNNSSDGWNLVGNPYPSTIDWNSVGWTKTNIDNAIYFDDYSTATPVFASYVNGVSTNGGSNLIGTGQGFWVKANANSPVLTIQESVKTPGTSTTLFRLSSPSNLIRVVLAKGDVKDETVVYFSESSTDGYDSKYDALKLKNPKSYPNLSSLSMASEKYSINSLPMLKGIKIVPLDVSNVSEGSYQLSFSGLGSFPASMNVILKDDFTNSSIDIREVPVYSFGVDLKNSSTFGSTRFSLVFGGSDEGILKNEITAYPNPTKGILTIEAIGDDASGQILNSLGVGIGSLSFDRTEKKQIAQYNLAGLSNGVYFVRLNQGGRVTIIRILKD